MHKIISRSPDKQETSDKPFFRITYDVMAMTRAMISHKWVSHIACSENDFNLVDDEAEYLRLKRAEEKAIRTQELQRLREREQSGWVSLMDLPIRNAGSVSVPSPHVSDEVDKRLREERFYEITKPEVYKGNSVLELESFFRGCENVFQIRPTTYKEHKAKLGFAVPLLANHPSGPNWAWTRHRANLNVALEPPSTWAEFCSLHINRKVRLQI